MKYADTIARLITELERLPGVGPKSAQRIAYHVLRANQGDIEDLAKALVDVKHNIRLCSRCFNFAEGELCGVCMDAGRDSTLICVVEEPRDVMAIERTGEIRGTYHVLHGAISPVDGVGPENLRIKGLLDRISNGDVAEILLATNPNVEGETTALYLARILAPLDVRVTRIALGLPVGGDLEYADELTLGRALEARREM
ncbi:MAG: recombination mediator RecR [Actinobacteria bacterium]|nr:recombination mediator RecR [Actinomycetota bacterium]MCL5888010.1 recombination mediator RecR [Actinomycetota bacterium]